ncbi:MAG: glycine cleavage system protein GcvH [Candidatus Thermoplasmatota archaeon]|nr:glycine cleavage system protein GcvH [Candidatus Poseidoniia archaeon]MEC8949290.1 glycine cleavage system protein GcvH [Candidatus Thermoplasmatota archaeon]MDP6534072.1 glycine cleavage system protein GcvH [Candidatus Poseidoniia archaeon]MDP6834877.1 glycine cleavage system protein GcvH [Candidatus Poseidoniia archaeon]MEC9336453.1 glycine cleavage system protein GcvH [Candidatus Thermoplasmatota archaeon]
MSDVPEELMYAETHEWVREREDGTFLVGITDHAQTALSDVVYVELPQVGDSFDAGQSFAVAESVKAASDVYAPMAGTVVEINSQLEEAPELVNESPYELGWIAAFQPAGTPEGLLDAGSYCKAIA